MTTTFIRNLNRNLNQMQKYHNQLTSGKLVSKPSDNPMLVSKIMSLSNNVMQNEQYGTNIKDTIGWVDTQDTALNNVSGTLNRIRDLIVYSANGPLSDTDRAAIKDEMIMKVGELGDALNSNFDGRYIFGGQKTNTRPYELVKVTEDGKTYEVLTYKGDDNNISREISPGVSIDMITNGERVTGEADKMGKLLKDIIVAMESGDTEELSGNLLKDIDVEIDNVIRVRSNIGAIQNRLDASLSRNETESLNIKKLLSEKEDIDVAEKYMEFSVMSSVYKASLSVGAQILQPSLLDYLR
jgi:flagellar hook-associated protein 3 FlgL